jgi:hypothetical protein
MGFDDASQGLPEFPLLGGKGAQVVASSAQFLSQLIDQARDPVPLLPGDTRGKLALFDVLFLLGEPGAGRRELVAELGHAGSQGLLLAARSPERCSLGVERNLALLAGLRGNAATEQSSQERDAEPDAPQSFTHGSCQWGTTQPEQVHVLGQGQAVHVADADETQRVLRAVRPDRAGDRVQHANPFGQAQLQVDQQPFRQGARRASLVDHNPIGPELYAAAAGPTLTLTGDDSEVRASPQSDSSFHLRPPFVTKS